MPSFGVMVDGCLYYAEGEWPKEELVVTDHSGAIVATAEPDFVTEEALIYYHNSEGYIVSAHRSPTVFNDPVFLDRCEVARWLVATHPSS